MIDWWSVFTNSLWIVGLAAALAIVSYSDWLASTQGKSLSIALRRLVHIPGFFLSISLASVGAGLGAAAWWDRGLWLLVAVCFALLSVRSRSGGNKDLQGG